VKGYTHLVLGIPHASGHPHEAIGASWGNDPAVTKERDRWTDWHTDELFAADIGDVSVVRCYGSRFDCDVERLEGEPDRICRHSLIDGSEDSAAFRNAMLAEWYEYRARLLDRVWRGGERPLVVDCHSFPSDVAPEVDVCIGFNDDATRPSDAILAALKQVFVDAGYRVAYNHPYGNAIAPTGYVGHSVMIEVSKRCYLDKVEMEKGEGFPKMASAIRRAYLRLLEREPLDETLQAIRDRRYYEYFRQYLDGIQRIPNGSQTWTDYCRWASPEAMRVIEIEQVAQDFDGLIPEAERAILDADLAEAKSCLYREDVDHLRRRYFIPVQHGGVMMFNRSYGYDTLPQRTGN